MTSAQHIRRRWRSLEKHLTLAFIALVLVLLGWRARTIDWDSVGDGLRDYDATTLCAAAALTAMSYLLHCCFDLFGRAYTRHQIPPRSVLVTAFVSYSFNQNFGTWVGGVGLRYRLYSRLGLSAGRTTRVLVMSLITNWSGYCLLAGSLLTAGLLPLPPEWGLGRGLSLGAGLLLLAVVAAYVGLCLHARQRSWHLHGVRLEAPALRLALLQLLLSSLSWTLIASVLYVLLLQKVPLLQVLAVLMAASFAAVLTHIPAGLGVLEAVFLALLGGQVGEGPLLAALLAYRAIYYLGPLLLGTSTYLALEARARPAVAQAQVRA